MGKGALGMLAAYWPEDTPRHAHVPLKRVTEIALHAPAATNADRPALVTSAGTTTYAELSGQVKEAAARLRKREARGKRVAVALEDPRELVVTMLAAWEVESLVFATSGPTDPHTLSLFEPDLRIGAAGEGSIAFADLVAGEAEDKADKPDFKKPLLAFATADAKAEVVHTHKTLGATAIAMANFLMIDADATVGLLEPPTHWLVLAACLGCWQKGGAVIAAYGPFASAPERVDYLVASWKTAEERILGEKPLAIRARAGLLVAIEGPFSLSRRRRMMRRLRSPILTVFGRSDLGPVLAAHASWFLDDAAGIPLPNVDTRPMNPTDGAPLNIGWDSVETAEIGVKSALSPIGAPATEGWLRSQTVASIDPTGLYFLKPEGTLR